MAEPSTGQRPVRDRLSRARTPLCRKSSGPVLPSSPDRCRRSVISPTHAVPRSAQPPGGTYRASAQVAGRTVATSATPAGIGIDRASGVRGAIDGSQVRVSWKGIAAARAYHVQLVDLDANEPIGEPVLATSESASLSLGTLPLERAGVSVEAWTTMVPGDAHASPRRET